MLVQIGLIYGECFTHLTGLYPPIQCYAGYFLLKPALILEGLNGVVAFTVIG